MEIGELSRHLIETESRFDITEIFDKSGYSPLHFASYKNSEKMAEVLCEYVRLYPSRKLEDLLIKCIGTWEI